MASCPSPMSFAVRPGGGMSGERLSPSGLLTVSDRARRRDHRFLRALRERRAGSLVIAHRGDSYHAPENTLEAAIRAWRAGADAWELDVQLTRDGVPVVVHDGSLLRTTNAARCFPADPRAAGEFRVGHLDFEEIRVLDAGGWFLADRPASRTAAEFGTRSLLDPEDVRLFGSGAVRVPSLREALELTARLDWLVNVELKTFWDPSPALLDAVLVEIRRLALVDRVLLSSFDHRTLARARDAEPGIATGVLTESPLQIPERYVAEFVQGDCYHPSASVLGAAGSGSCDWPASQRLDRATLRALHDQGLSVLVYTVNDVRPGGIADQLARAGVDGLFTDDPAGMRRAVPGAAS